MKRFSRQLSTLAILLAVLLPLEQAHCMWMSVTPAATSSCGAAASGMHACCAAKAARSVPAPSRVPAPARGAECPCVHLPPATAPAATVQPLAPQTPMLIVPARAELPAPAVVAELLPRIDTGPAPPGRTRGAHGLRAPPLLG